MMDGFDWLEPAEFPAWRKRIELERLAHNLTLHRQVCLRALLCFVGTEGLFPSDAAVAKLAGCSSRTVRRARMDARALGLLTWQRTRKVVNGRWRQGTNVYSIIIPASPVCPRPDGQRGRQRQLVEESKRPTGATAAALMIAPGYSTLAEIARTREAAIAAAYWARRTGVAAAAAAG